MRPALARFVFILLCGCARLPQITKDEIIFAGGESLRYQGAAPIRDDATGARQARFAEEQPVVLRRLSPIRALGAIATGTGVANLTLGSTIASGAVTATVGAALSTFALETGVAIGSGALALGQTAVTCANLPF